MNIICGDAFGVSCGTWIAFWNGAIGAFVAAIIGGGVALLVVRLTNAQQRRGVSRSVEIAAIADFVSAMEELDWDAHYKVSEGEIFDPGKHVLLLRAATTRLAMSHKDGEALAAILTHWPYHMSSLVLKHRRAHERGLPFAADILRTLSSAATSATVCLPSCSAADRTKRASALQGMQDADQKLREDLERYDNVLDEVYRSEAVGRKGVAAEG